jgi:glycosyltransferase involved in cell wall biosynthesis
MKPVLAISCPASSRSGYGDHSRDLIRSLISMDKFDIKILDQVWGGCPRNALNPDTDQDIITRCIGGLEAQPDVWIQVTVPNEFQPVGKYNIGITAGMETDLISAPWVQGCNRMNLIIVPSKHSKEVFEKTTYDQQDKNTGQKTGELRVTTPIEVLFEGLDLNTYNKITDKSKLPATIVSSIDEIPEDFCFLFVGHWLSGQLHHDRKDVGGMLQTFLHTFKDQAPRNQPALIIKTSSATFSVIDREDMIRRINGIKAMMGSNKLPNIYLLHGDLTPSEMNGLYNHPKVKSMVSFTHGEGFGRPLLEFSVTGKPVVATNWSGHIDFLDKYGFGLPGELKPVHDSATWKDVIIPESKWFYVNHGYASGVLKDVVKNYKVYLETSRKQTQYVKSNFTLEKMDEVFKDMVNRNVPEFPKQQELVLPKLPKLNPVKLPKLEKQDV